MAGASILGGVLGAQGAKQQAEATATAGRFNADMLDYKAQLQDVQAQIYMRNVAIARNQAAQSAKDKNKVVAATLGSIRAAYGANGLSLEGSPLDVLEAAAIEGQLDINKELYKGDVLAAGWLDQANMTTVEAQLSRRQAGMARYGADMAIDAGNIAAMASIISGIGGAGKAFSGMAAGASAGGSGVRAPGSGTLA